MIFPQSLVLSCALLISGASALISDYSLAVVDAEYAASGLDNSGDSGFGLTLKSQAVLNVTYDFGSIELGGNYSAAALATQPSVRINPGSNLTADTYTLTLADASSLGDPDTEGNYRHFLANSLERPSASLNSTSLFTPSNGTTITYYAAPGPLVGTGPHRYAWLLFAQPSSFQAPSNLSTSGVAPGHWSVEAYANSANLELIAATFFTVQNGEPTGSVAATSAVNTASIAAEFSSAGSSAAASAATSSFASIGSLSKTASTAAAAASSAASSAASGASSAASSAAASATGSSGAAGIVASSSLALSALAAAVFLF